MARRDISSLCQSVLPPGFAQVRRQLPAVQQFLQENLPEAVRQNVTLLSITPEQIVIAANSPLVTNYLRLHSGEIRQQLQETFQLSQALKFRTIPDALMQQRKPQALQGPRQVSDDAVAAIRRNAQWIEDEALRAAMLQLADSLAGDSTETPAE